MDLQQEDKKKTIDAAIETCQKSINGHRRSSLIILLLLIFAIVSSVTFLDLFRRQNIESNDNFYYLAFGILIIFFSVMISLYRFHLKELTKRENMLIGFHRIRIAGNNKNETWDDLVRSSLVQDAFAFSEDKPTNLLQSRKKVENPLPGHLTFQRF